MRTEEAAVKTPRAILALDFLGPRSSFQGVL